ncbi:MAG: hypothetical protein J2P51_07350 [Hyphomicrobiaceae bacterium]|nr:hypothetical protein [Hyphomicrobiaceae bacterium]
MTSEPRVATFLLELESERAGDFRPLRFRPKHKTSRLSPPRAHPWKTKTPCCTIEEATHVVAVDPLGLSSQCGFASGNATEEERAAFGA